MPFRKTGGNENDDHTDVVSDDEGVVCAAEEQGEIQEPSVQEVKEIIAHLKNNKSGGENGIVAELLKVGTDVILDRLHQLVLRVWKEERMPKDWKTAILCPIYKKGDRSICNNYRGIALLDVCYKIFAQIIKERLNLYSTKELGEYQGGFRKGRSTVDQIFTLKQIQNNSYAQNLGLHVLFIDYKQAYDSVNRERMYTALHKLKIPENNITG